MLLAIHSTNAIQDKCQQCRHGREDEEDERRQAGWEKAVWGSTSTFQDIVKVSSVASAVGLSYKKLRTLRLDAIACTITISYCLVSCPKCRKEREKLVGKWATGNRGRHPIRLERDWSMAIPG